ncbi:Hypothetical predicted protein [Paramuricea clavata]|uniref:Uncharacterized protein n=1 Tax=Paramuricea clavata TaxID=317549 RepID=A0A6S7HGP6_PARCT|nr:Hypothetical predicted protein [Paramuricea clavata]
MLLSLRTKSTDLHDALLILYANTLRSLPDGGVTIRVNHAPASSVLNNDKILIKLISSGINLEMGRPKDLNKIPFAEHAIASLVRMELLNLHPEGGPVSKIELALAIPTEFPNPTRRHF